VVFAYGTLMIGRWGRTVGMMKLDLRVTDRQGGDIGWGRAALRTAVLLLPFIAGYLLRYQPLPGTIVIAAADIGLLWIMVDRAHQGYHDKIAGTLVMREQHYQQRRALGQAVEGPAAR
jgi:uncharacterized RDD family membrane protein YckC